MKGRKHDHMLFCNSVAQSIIESVRGRHGRVRLRLLAGVEGTAVPPDRNDEQHGVAEMESAMQPADDVLWHTREDDCALLKIREALENMTSGRHANNDPWHRSLRAHKSLLLSCSKKNGPERCSAPSRCTT